MLVNLRISNFAIIKEVEITLKDGLNILSGETGAGKSIIINAVNLILGGRASADLIRTGCNDARVEALFIFPENEILSSMLSELGFPFEGELVIKRTITREGRNRIFINDSIATLQVLSRLGAMLLSISGQHEHQLLLRPENHLYLLDDFGGLSDERRELGVTVGRYISLMEETRQLEKDIRDITEKEDLARFQLQEIEDALIVPGEDGMLLEEKKRLQHAEELQEIVTEAYQALYEANDSALTAISQCAKRVSRAAAIDRGIESIRDGLDDIQVKLEDVAFELRDFRETIRIDPYRLNELAERLELLNRLKRKYGPCLEDVLAFREKLATGMSDIEEKRDRLASRKKDLSGLEKIISKKSDELSGKRKEAALRLEESVEKELNQLHMADTRFRVGFGESDHKEVQANGYDRVEFMVAPNVGEELRPLSRTASGGELSRIMLSLKGILAGSASIETVIFDEVDSGISGATAEVVGEKLLSLARYHQILCITHLPQIASQGQTHFLVKKEIVDARTHTMVSMLDQEARVKEIARLLGGREITDQALAHATEMLNGI
ncbi:MAG: DNA repair protein RecN [Deltaproteobacteria bacterium]|nr:DNA repair protein RecN [Deltaproteobacteria bacterium]